MTFQNNTSLAAPGALAHRLQRRTACKIQNGRKEGRKAYAICYLVSFQTYRY